MTSNTLERRPLTMLAVESAICGGSLALFHGADLLVASGGSSTVSRAEELLLKIKDLVTNTVGSISEINSIAVSIGPGSFTGLRIGISTTMGLGKALQIKCSGVSLFDAMATLSTEGKLVLTAVPLGKRDACFQLRKRNDKGFGVHAQPRTVPLSDLVSAISELQPSSIVYHGDLESRIRPLSAIEMIDAGSNMAEVIGRCAMNTPVNHDLTPIYAQSPRFV